MNKISVIMPNLNERLVDFTCKRVYETTTDVDEIIVVNDGAQYFSSTGKVRSLMPWEKPKGTAAARDAGIMEAKNDMVILLDAHMNFNNGDTWSERLHDVIKATPKTISAPGSCKLDHDTLLPTPWEGNMGIRYGTTISRLTEDKKRNRQHVMGSKWRDKYSLPGEVQSVLGACYGFSREWYIDGLRRPWKGLLGWGTLEQSLTIPNWLCGGRSYVIPAVVGHLYRIAKQVPYPQDQAKLWFNKFRLIQILPYTDAEKNELRARLTTNIEVKALLQRVTRLIAENGDETEQIRRFLDSQDRDMSDYWQQWTNNKGGGMKRPEIIKELTRRGVKGIGRLKVAELEKRLGLELKKETQPPKTAKPKAKPTTTEPPRGPIANYGAYENGRTCRKCGSAASVVNNTKKVGKRIIRYRTCLKCKANRATQEFLP